MALEFVGATSGVNSASLPSGWQPGDIAVVFAFRDGSTAAPTLPSGFTDWINGGASTCAQRVGYRTLATGDTGVGTWTNATTVEVQVWRPAGGSYFIGSAAQLGTAGTTVTYPALTLISTAGDSRVLRFAGHRSVNTALEAPPSGYTLARSTVDTTDETASFYSSGTLSSNPTAANVAVGGTSSGWRSVSVELGFNPDPPTITTQPANTTVAEGATASFTVVADNATGYQWQVNDGGSPVTPTILGFERLVEGVNNITVPAGTQAVLATVAWWDGANNVSGMTPSSFVDSSWASNLSITNAVVGSPDNSGVARTQGKVTATGAQTVTVSTTGTIQEGATGYIVYVADVNPDDFLAQRMTSSPGLNVNPSVTVSTEASGLLVAVDSNMGNSFVPANVTGWTSADTYQQDFGNMRLRGKVVESTPSETVSGGGDANQYLAMTVWSLKPAGGFANVTDGSGATTANYSRTAALADSGKQYRVNVTGPGGSVTSSAATLTVTPGGGATTQTRTASLALAIQAARSAAASVAVPVQAHGQASASVGLSVRALRTAAADVSTAVQQARAASALVAIAVRESRSQSAGVTLAAQRAEAAAAALDLAIQQARAGAVAVDLQVQAASELGASIRLMVQAGQAAAQAVDVLVQQARAVTADLALAVQAGRSTQADIDLAVQRPEAADLGVRLAIEISRTRALGVDLQVQDGFTQLVAVAAAVQLAQTAAASLSAAVQRAASASTAVSAAVSVQRLLAAEVDVAVQRLRLGSAGVSVFVVVAGQLMRWDGAAWSPVELKRFDGAAWVNAELKRWNGADWI